MQKNTILFVVIALFVGFIAGFWLANSLNRSAIGSGAPQKPQASPNSNTQQPAKEPELTDEEIKAKIAEADRNPTNFTFQKEFGTALYQYAAMKQDTSLLPDAARILDRAIAIDPKDFEALASAGNAHFDIGFAKKDARQFQKAREIYTNALELKPGDPNVSTDLGLTYYWQEPPAYEKAAAPLQKVIDANSQHTRSMHYLIPTLLN